MLKKITAEEKQIIIDALLFASSCDINADFSSKYLDKMVEIAKKLGGNPSKRLSLYVGGVLEDEKRSKDILKNFIIKHEK